MTELNILLIMCKMSNKMNTFNGCSKLQTLSGVIKSSYPFLSIPIKKVDSLLRKINGITFMEKLLPQCILSVYNNVYIKNLWTLVPLRSMFQNNELR